MEAGYLIDTNIIIYASKGLIPQESLDKVQQIFRNSYNISPLTEIELLGAKNLDDVKFNRLKKFISISRRYELNDEIIAKTIEIRRKNGIKTPDAIIGATALANKMVLVTRNVKDFKRIKGLEIYNPFTD